MSCRLRLLASGLRRGLECAARQRHLTDDQVAKLIGHITWSCLLRRTALSLIDAGYRFARTFGPRSGRACPQSPRNSVGLRHYCRCSLAILPVLGRCGFMSRMPLVAHEEALELRVANVILRRFSRCPLIALSSKTCHPSYNSPVWRCLEETFGDLTERG